MALEARTVEASRTAVARGGATTLALAELKRGWPSWLLSVLGMLFLAAVGATAVAGPFLVGWTGGVPTALSDSFLLFTCTCLAYNWADGRYFRLWQDPFAERLRFLRSLPVPARDLVLGRMLTMVIGLLVLTPVFFLPPYLLVILDGAPPAPAAYASYALVWAGYGLFSGGVMLWLELGFRGKTANWLLYTWGLAIFIVFALLRFGLDVRVAAGTAELVRAHGPLPAVLSLLAGAAAFALLGLATLKRLERRELA